jgi:integrase
MPKPPSYDSRRRERVGPNLYKRVTRDGRERFDAAFRDADGRMRFAALKATSQRAAEREVRAMLAKRDSGERVVGSSVTLRAFAETEYLPLIDSLAAAGRRSERGVDSDRDRWRLHIEPRLGDRPLGKIDGRHVSELVRDMREDGYSEGTIQRVLVVLRSIYRLARTRKLVTRSPVDELDPSEKPKPKQGGAGRVLDEMELHKLVRNAPEHHKAVVAVLAYSGLRISEVLGLRWRDVDFVTGELDVNGQIQPPTRRTPRAGRVERLKTDASFRLVPIFPAAEQTLIDHLAVEQEAGRGGDDDLVFQTRHGKPLSARNVAQRGVEKAATDAGLGKVTPKDLRASFCSLAGRRGVDPAEAAQMTGHSLAVWATHYARSFGHEQRLEARARMLEHGFGALD